MGPQPDSRNGSFGVPKDASSFHFDSQLPDGRPSFLDHGLLHRAERLRRLLLARVNLESEAGETRLYDRIGQCLGRGRIEPVDDLLRRAPRCEKPVEANKGGYSVCNLWGPIETRQSFCRL